MIEVKKFFPKINVHQNDYSRIYTRTMYEHYYNGNAYRIISFYISLKKKIRMN